MTAVAPARDYTVPEIAEALRLSEWQVRKLIRRGDLGATNVSATSGRPTYRISAKHLQTYRTRREVRVT